MGSIALDNGESVYVHDGTAAADPVAISAAEGSSVANLFKKRERFDFTWANAAERGSQTGMVSFSRGIQEDTKTEYVYDGGQWRLASPYIELSAGNQSFGAGNYLAQTGWSVDATRSTDTALVTVSGGVFTFVRAGIYMISCTTNFDVFNASTLQVLTDDAAHLNFISISGYVGGVSTLTTPYRISADSTPLYLWAYNAAAATLGDRRVRIVRTG